jgi:recombination protein RecT
LELVAPDGQITHSLDWRHHEAVPLLKHVSRLTAPNPGMMTGPGTNTYIIGGPGAYAVIDPGPADDQHVDRIAAIVGTDLRFILCTHAHPDHSPGAVRLKSLTGAPVLGRAWAARVRNYALPDGSPPVEDPAFIPDRELNNGDRIVVGDSTLRAIHTPGHASNHLCFLLEEDGLLFSGDHINSGSTVVISPPDGNMVDYLKSLEGLLSEAFDYILPAHGHVIGFGHQAVKALIAHRLSRESKVVKALGAAPDSSMEQLVSLVYDDVRPALHPVAARSLLAHLKKPMHDGRANVHEDRWRLEP